MDVLLTGASGTVGTAITDYLGGDYAFTTLDREEGVDVVADIAEFDDVRPVFDGMDAVVHLAGDPRVDAPWDSVLRNNVVGTVNVVRAAHEADVGRVVFASSNHAVGMYEVEGAPDIYGPGFDLTVDHTVPVRPDSPYGVSKVFGEATGRYYSENGGPRFYALRICTVHAPEYDHPYGEAERGVDEGRWERGSDGYAEAVARQKAMWHSRRDLAQLVDCCLRDESVEYDVFYGVSDNAARWFDVDHARRTVGYEPRDSADEWDAPPGAGDGTA